MPMNKEAKRDYMRKYMRERSTILRKFRVKDLDGRWFNPEVNHGTCYGYEIGGCRCVPCRERHNTRNRG